MTDAKPFASTGKRRGIPMPFAWSSTIADVVGPVYKEAMEKEGGHKVRSTVRQPPNPKCHAQKIQTQGSIRKGLIGCGVKRCLKSREQD